MQKPLPRYYAHTVLLASLPEQIKAHSAIYEPNSEADTIEQLCAAFISDYAAKQHVKVTGNGTITTLRGTKLAPKDRLTQVLKDRDDVFISLTRVETSVPKSSVSATGALASATQFQLQQERIATLTEAAQHFKQGHSLRALKLYQQLLPQLSPTIPEHAPLLQTCHQQSAVIYYQAKRWQNAITSLNAALIHAKRSDRLLKQQSDYSQLHLLLGVSCYQLTSSSRAATDMSDESVLNFEKALEFALQQKKQSKTSVDDLHLVDCKLWLARALLLCDDIATGSIHNKHQSGVPPSDSAARQRAVALLEELTHSHESHVASLLYYAKVAIDSNLSPLQTLPYLVRCLTLLQQQPKLETRVDQHACKQTTQLLLVKVVTDAGEKGFNALMSELQGASQNASVLSFLAQQCKTVGGIQLAVKLYNRALQYCTIDPRIVREESSDQQFDDETQITLNLVHTLELTYEYQNAFQLIQSFVAKHQTSHIGSQSITTFHEIISSIQSIDDDKLKLGTASVPAWRNLSPAFDEQHDGSTPSIITAASEPGGKTLQQQIESTAAAPEVPSSHGDTQSSDDSIQNPYPSVQLNLLALVMTMCKILFVRGALQPLPALIELIEPLRRDRQLHLTLIRNESAYFCTAAQLVRRIKQFPLPVQQKRIHVLGDSHALTPAWNTIQVNNEPRLLQPALATGCKCWHMRDEDCKFYVYNNFVSACESIPQGATVISIFGEIDCRTSLLVATEKALYDSMEDAINATAKIYVDSMTHLANRKQCAVFIHPVPPVLDPTRPVVRQFNALLKQQVRNSEKLRWIDIEADLLDDSGAAFNRSYALDGTHLSSSYVSLLRRELNAEHAQARPH